MSPKYDAFGRPVAPPSEDGSAPHRPRPRPAGDDGPERRNADGTFRGDVGRRPVDDATAFESRSTLPPTSTTGRPGRRGLAAAVPAVLALLLVVGAVALGVLASDDADRPRARPGTARTAGLDARAAVERLRTIRGAIRPGERVLYVTIGAEFASARLVAPAGSAAPSRTVALRDDGDLVSYGGSASATGSRGADPRGLDAEAPRRIMAAVERGLGPGSSARVSSVSVSAYGREREPDPPLDWTASVRGGPSVASSWRSDEHGRHVVRIRDGAPAPAAGERGPAVVPTGTAGRSLLAPTNLRAAIAAAVEAAGAPAQVTNLDVRPQRLQVGTVVPGEPRRSVVVNAALGVETPSVLTRSAPSIRAARIDPAAPDRALRLIGRRLSLDAGARASFAILQVPDPDLGGGPLRWLVTLDRVSTVDRSWQATADGRRVARLSETLRP